MKAGKMTGDHPRSFHFLINKKSAKMKYRADGLSDVKEPFQPRV
jgi:hypothetical protein